MPNADDHLGPGADHRLCEISGQIRRQSIGVICPLAVLKGQFSPEQTQFITASKNHNINHLTHVSQK
jgi:hypothetical protein